MEKQLSQYPTQQEYQVHWGDMDAANHVNNLVYLRWAESGRIYYFEQMGMDTSFSGSIGPILGWQDCKYIFPITYPDTAIVGVKTVEIQTDRLILETAIFSKNKKRIAAISKQSIIPYSYTLLKKVGLPTKWIEGIQGLEDKTKPL